MPEIFDLILPDDPLGQLIDPQQTYVVGQIIENVPIVVDVPIQVAKILAPNGTDTGAMKAGDVIGGYTLQLNDLVFCQSSFAEDSGCFLVGSTTSILVYQTALVQIQIGLSGGKIFTLKPAVGYEELVTGGGGGITEEDSIVNALIFG